ncbi:MAG: NifU family protein [Campylobacterota bacterium]|nr:NifU family protein [Campylobacterota bacterium]
MSNEENFKQKTLTEKINAIDAIIEEDIRSFLHKDNGDLDLINVEEKNEHIIVYIEYQGACVSCPASGGTLMSIQNILQRKLSEHIRVLSV